MDCWSWWTDLNPRPADYKSAALPTELHQRANPLVVPPTLFLFHNNVIIKIRVFPYWYRTLRIFLVNPAMLKFCVTFVFYVSGFNPFIHMIISYGSIVVK